MIIINTKYVLIYMYVCDSFGSCELLVAIGISRFLQF